MVGKAIRVYPNPVKEVANIRMETPQGATVELYSATGGLVRSAAITDSYPLNLSTQTNGVYILKIATKTGRYTAKLVKE